MPLIIDQGMPNEMPETFARRARLSSKAILTAVALTLGGIDRNCDRCPRGAPAIVKTFGTSFALAVPVDGTQVSCRWSTASRGTNGSARTKPRTEFPR